jgi:hypothetical protein
MEKAQLLQAIEEAKAELAKAQEDGALEYEAIQAKIAATRDRIRDSKAYCIAQDMASGVKYDLDGPDSVIYHAAMITLAKAVGVVSVLQFLSYAQFLG